MKRSEVTITNRSGISARSSAKLALAANRYASAVWLQSGNKRADAKNVMAVMLLGVRAGTTMVVEAQGDDAEAALRALVDLVDRQFDDPEHAPRKGAR